jgi:hypothetical protein
MKKFLSLILIVAATFTATNLNAQVTMAETDPAGATSTVNTNADTSYHTIQLAGQTNNHELLTFIIKGTKTSGTVAGTVTLWGSNDNSRWFAVYGASTAALSDTVTTQNLTDASVDLSFHVNKTRFRYYRIRVITSGTQVSAYDCTVLGRKVPN